YRVRAPWRSPLLSALGAASWPTPEVVRSTAGFLLASGAAERAVPLHLALGDHQQAATALESCAEDLVQYGQWQTLEGWLDQLGDQAVATSPKLIHSQAELAAARGASAHAQRGFARASALFAAGRQPERACRSLLASTMVTAAMGDLPEAR